LELLSANPQNTATEVTEYANCEVLLMPEAFLQVKMSVKSFAKNKVAEMPEDQFVLK